MIWRVVANEDRAEAAAYVERWGYFREVTPDEIRHCTWFSGVARLADGAEEDIAFLWFTEGPEEDAIAAHVATAPGSSEFDGSGGWHSSEQVMHEVETIAGLMGANRLYSLLIDGRMAGLRVDVVKRWLRTRGWCEHEFGMFRDLGG